MALDGQGSGVAGSGVVITGASSGIGRECALYLDRRGYRVFAGVRKAADGEALAKVASPRLSPLIIDVTDAGTIAEAARQVGQALGEVALVGLVNNAGIGVDGPRTRYLVGRDAKVMAFFPLAATRSRFRWPAGDDHAATRARA